MRARPARQARRSSRVDRSADALPPLDDSLKQIRAEHIASIGRESIKVTFVDDPEASADRRRSAVEIDIQRIGIAEVVVSLLQIGALRTALLVAALHVQSSAGAVLYKRKKKNDAVSIASTVNTHDRRE